MKLKKFRKKKEVVHKNIENVRFLLKENFPDENFWNQPEEVLQLTTPWLHSQLQEIRAELYVKAIALHKSFIVGAKDPLINNINVMSACQTQDIHLPELDNLPSLWASFFLVVPVVSTTFASFGRLFRELHKEALGWLLIDEAGQSAPQAAAGAIWRSRRVIAVGDPMQIEPVVTIPKTLEKWLFKLHNLDLQNNSNDCPWAPSQQSVQTLADRANALGTNLNLKGFEAPIWIGCPLRVHRRCNNPMFSISNEIAYDNMMLNASNNKSTAIEKIIPQSLWVHVNGKKVHDNWIVEEGEKVIEILKKITHEANSLPSIFIISPFKSVSYNMVQMLLSTIGEWSPSSLSPQSARNWVYKSVGTIHTFQGKEAEIVFLLLGSNPKKSGTRVWASSKPNILNVAITRAKNLLIVIGNNDTWKGYQYFDLLNKKLNKASSHKAVA